MDLSEQWKIFSHKLRKASKKPSLRPGCSADEKTVCKKAPNEKRTFDN